MRELVCIVCPTGCRMKAEERDGALCVSGNKCKRGEAFARAECTHPMRTLCSTVRTVFPQAPVLPVRTAGEIPKEKLFAAMRELRRLVLTHPVKCGEVLVQNLAGTGCALIATSGILEEGAV